MDIVQKLKKLNLKQPKYVFPLIVLLPLLFLGYTVAQFFTGSSDGKTGIVTDSINMSLPDARSDGLDSKMAAMDKHFSEGGAFSAVNGIGDDVVEKDTTGSGYNDEELAKIQQANAERLAQQEAEANLQRSYAENSRRLNGYSSGSSGRSSRSQQDDLNDYARELENIQNRSMERQRRYYAEQERKDKEEEAEQRRQQQEMIDALTGNGKKKSKANEKTEVVEKVKEKNAEQFNTVTSAETADEPLIKAIIDKTTKAREGTRLRFKLLDDVTVKGIRLKKGSYLYCHRLQSAACHGEHHEHSRRQ